ncbi:MAG: GTPase [Candidatus Aminicenantaceae bacterium]
MPANLPPQYFETEKKLKVAKTPQEKIRILEELLSIVPKHKGTEKLQALLKTKIAKLKSTAQKKPSIARHSSLHRVERSGAGQIILIGPPNSGKSMLVKSLTNATPEIGEYPFTTRLPYPAMMEYENIKIQLVDTPPVTPEYMESWLLEMIKESDGILILLDLSDSSPINTLKVLLSGLKEKKIELISEKEKTIETEVRFFPKRALVVANKKDVLLNDNDFTTLKGFCKGKFNLISLSALHRDGLDELRKHIFLMLDVIRVYSKIPGKKADLNAPYTLKRGSSVLDMAREVHKDFTQKLKYARIWSKNKYQGQMVNRDHILEDEDILELHI